MLNTRQWGDKGGHWAMKNPKSQSKKDTENILKVNVPQILAARAKELEFHINPK